MPKVKHTAPAQTRQKGQRQLELPNYLTRYLPQWNQPEWFNGDVWRRVVRGQPFAMDCRETLISSLTTLDYKVEPRDSTKRDEYSEEIEYYTKFFEDTGDHDYIERLEWIVGDMLDLPFGAAAELGWEGDTPPSEGNGNRLLWIEPIDGATLFPTLNRDWPVGQSIREQFYKTVYFPNYAINRLYFSPRQEILRKGWGMAPPEKVYLGLALLNRGDAYYANLLLDTPEVGILDLGNMSEASAKEWVQSWRDLLGGVDAFKIPVLYEHDSDVKFVSFTRPPTEMLFDRTVMTYRAIVASGYGLSLSDLGIQAVTSGGETLAGSIRQERKTRRTGFARIKQKVRLFYNRMLPPYLQYSFIDLDDELSVAIGRALLAFGTAANQLVEGGMFTEEEMRQEAVAQGYFSSTLPEALPEEARQRAEMNRNPQAKERPALLGKPEPASAGGHGEVKSAAVLAELDPEFREVYDEIQKHWCAGELDLNTKAQISEIFASRGLATNLGS